MTAATSAPASRGRTTVGAHAVERIAAHALSEVDGVGGTARTMLGIAVGADGADRDARVSARVAGAEVELTVRMSVAYPASVRATARRAREHLTTRVGGLTGLHVSTVDVTVTELYQDVAAPRRVS
ncbi:Asp23/Gls24 family envelope stress response protein [Actinophytocola glycyrrhizae]|uniref:Asp23/Gls24 family envelope stress response protein n=1 Tax=Actinophytocola glycyrrhizae TaxID=2044873 RepID=A0ABV9SAN3_9PSEU